MQHVASSISEPISAARLNDGIVHICIWAVETSIHQFIQGRLLKSHDFAMRLTFFSSISRSHDETQKSHHKQSHNFLV